MRVISPVYLLLLFNYSIVMIVFILAGSHGRLILTDKETLQGIGVIFVFLTTAVVNLIKRKRIENGMNKFGLAGLNIFTIVLICYQIDLLNPGTYTILSIFVIGLHILGLAFGALITYKVVAHKNTRNL
jgi:hypothetical protein